jgi:hypothetical protein
MSEFLGKGSGFNQLNQVDVVAASIALVRAFSHRLQIAKTSQVKDITSQ